MVCPKCNGSDIKIQIVNEAHWVNDHHSIFWWILIGWWWLPIKWIFFTIPALILKLLFPRKKIVNKTRKVCVCQSCGYHWEIN